MGTNLSYYHQKIASLLTSLNLYGFIQKITSLELWTNCIKSQQKQMGVISELVQTNSIGSSQKITSTITRLNSINFLEKLVATNFEIRQTNMSILLIELVEVIRRVISIISHEKIRVFIVSINLYTNPIQLDQAIVDSIFSRFYHKISLVI